MMRLTERIHLVGGGSWSGAGLSPNPDCHVYLIDGGDELAIIDAGSGVPGSREAIRSQIQAAGFSPAQVNWIFVTHMHGDHLGGVQGLVELTNAPACGSAETVTALTTGDEEVTSIRVAREAGLYPETFTLPATEGARSMTDLSEVWVGTVRVTAHATPGHCSGHVSYVLDDGDRADLFAGDAVFWRGRVLTQAIAGCDPLAMAESIARLNALDVEGFFPGHGAFTISGATRHLTAAASQVGTLRMPEGL